MRVSTRPALERLQMIDLAVRRQAWPNARTLARDLEVTRRTIHPTEIFRVLVKAVRHSRQLGMVYWTASRGETQRRTVDPYDLVLAPDDDWCLIGHCHLRNDIRLFKVQRLRSAVETGECFCSPPDFRPKEFMAESFGTIRGDGDFQVVLRFTTAYAGLIAEKQWHASQGVESRPDGGSLLRVHVNELRQVKRWVMFWGGGLQLVAFEPTSDLS